MNFFDWLNEAYEERAPKRKETALVETSNLHTIQAENGFTKDLSIDEAKRNADFWNMVHGRAGDAHLAAGKTWMVPCSGLTAIDRVAFSKALNYLQLIIGTNGELNRAKEKFHTDDMFQIFRMLKHDDIIL